MRAPDDEKDAVIGETTVVEEETLELRARLLEAQRERDQLKEELQASRLQRDSNGRHDLDVPDGMFIVGNQFSWIECEDPEFPGFKIYVRTGITNQEKDLLTERHNQQVVAWAETWRELDSDHRDYGDSPRERQKRMIAPYVHGWNAMGYDPEGNLIALPPPREAGSEIFNAIYDEMYEWMAYVVIGGYTVLGKAGPWRKQFEPTGTMPESETEKV